MELSPLEQVMEQFNAGNLIGAYSIIQRYPAEVIPAVEELEDDFAGTLDTDLHNDRKSKLAEGFAALVEMHGSEKQQEDIEIAKGLYGFSKTQKGKALSRPFLLNFLSGTDPDSEG